MHAKERPDLGCYCCEKESQFNSILESASADIRYTVWRDPINRRNFDYEEYVKNKLTQRFTDKLMGISLTGAPFLAANNEKEVDPIYPNIYG